MPPARRRSGAKQDAANTSTEAAAETTEAEATEGEGEGEEEAKPKAPRTPKTYTVTDAELANSLVGDDFEDEIAEGDAATGEMLDSMRRNKAKWDSPEDGGIKHVFGSKTAIPLRKIYQEWHAAQDEDNALDIEDVDALFEALVTEGQGWVQLAARTGNTQAEVREALKEKVAEEFGEDIDITAGGRAYGKGENWTWVTADQLTEAKKANAEANGDDEEEGEDEEGADEGTDDATDTEASEATDEEAPAPRRRRRAPAA